MDRDIYRKNLHELDLRGLAELSANVARSVSANSKQSDMAHTLRVESIRILLDGSLNGDKAAAENSLKEGMEDSFAGLPKSN